MMAAKILNSGGGLQKYASQQRGFSVDEITQRLWLKLRESKVALLEQLIHDEAA